MIFLFFLFISFCVSSPISQTKQIQDVGKTVTDTIEQLYFILVNDRSKQLESMCQHGDREMVQSLLKDGADPAANDNYCIRVACHNGDRLMVSLLLSLDPAKGVDPSVHDNFCLREASFRNHYFIVYMLLSLDPSRGVDPTAEDYRIIFEAALRDDYYFLIWILQDRRVNAHYDTIRERAVILKNSYDNDKRISLSSSIENFIGFLDRSKEIFTSGNADIRHSMRIIETVLRENYSDFFKYLSHPDFNAQKYGILTKVVRTLAQGRTDWRFDSLIHYLSKNEFYLTTDPFENNYEALLKLRRENNWDAIDYFLEFFSSDQLTEAIEKIPCEALRVRITSFQAWKYPSENKLGI